MCVIMASKTQKPPKEWMQQAAIANPDGAGLSWIQAGKVHYLKNIDPQKAIAKMAEIKPPYVLHFRLASIGEKSSALCHPFPVSVNVPLTTVGTCEAALSHNGHWANWDDMVKQTVMMTKTRFPFGEWSDSRGMAFMAGVYGLNFMSFMPKYQKIAILTASGRLLTYGEGWIYDESEKDIWLSNDGFMKKMYASCAGYHGSQGDFYKDKVWDAKLQKYVKKEEKSVILLSDAAKASLTASDKAKIQEAIEKLRAGEEVLDEVPGCCDGYGNHWVAGELGTLHAVPCDGCPLCLDYVGR
jgi:hypothetical protein